MLFMQDSVLSENLTVGHSFRLVGAALQAAGWRPQGELGDHGRWGPGFDWPLLLLHPSKGLQAPLSESSAPQHHHGDKNCYLTKVILTYL